MHGPINVKFPNNASKWQVGFNSAFKGLNEQAVLKCAAFLLQFIAAFDSPKHERFIIIIN
jgi:hypothetical protein